MSNSDSEDNISQIKTWCDVPLNKHCNCTLFQFISRSHHILYIYWLNTTFSLLLLQLQSCISHYIASNDCITLYTFSQDSWCPNQDLNHLPNISKESYCLRHLAQCGSRRKHCCYTNLNRVLSASIDVSLEFSTSKACRSSR